MFSLSLIFLEFGWAKVGKIGLKSEESWKVAKFGSLNFSTFKPYHFPTPRLTL
jgi:hypothetical protein